MISKRISEMLRSTIEYPRARECDVGAPGVINLASNESPYGPSPNVLRALRRELKFLGRYPDSKMAKLRVSIGKYLNIDSSCIAIGNGSDELLDLVCKAFLDPGDRVFIPLPTFPLYELFSKSHGAEPVFYNLPNFEWRANELLSAAKGTKLIFITRPNNPTGNSLSLSGLLKLLGLGNIVVADEAYVDFDGDSSVRLATKKKNLVVFRTFSKAFGLAGLRIGYAVANPDIIKVIDRIRAPFNVNRFAQAAALAALEDRRHVLKVVNLIKSGRTYLSRELCKLGIRILPSEANFLMADVSPLGVEALRFCDLLADHKIFVRDLSNFKGAGPKYVRITVGSSKQNEKLVCVVKEIFRGV